MPEFGEYFLHVSVYVYVGGDAYGMVWLYDVRGVWLWCVTCT